MSYLTIAADKTPDPHRSLNNLKTFLKSNPDYENDLKEHIDYVAILFACSQFLANFSIKRPIVLFQSVRSLKSIQNRNEIFEDLASRMQGVKYDEALSVLREFRKEQMIKITVRTIMDMSDTLESMDQLSDLADAIITATMEFVNEQLKQKFGVLEHHSFAVFALGKLGAQELNYSSDVDLIFVYGDERGQTSGVKGLTGTVINVIDNHEYYCKMATEIGKVLSQNTEDGFVYRVDMRLRPDGQRGDAALSLGNYELYYESWGREWERLALLRARFICGDERMGEAFVAMLAPFVWRKYIDYSTIDEIKDLKVKIDATFKKDDIKRGYGGIREIEFFMQSLQLIYGGKEPLLRQRRTLIALHMLKQKNLIGDDDHWLLSENYIYLRKIEHYIQMLNDVQTHTLPVENDQREALGRKLGYERYDEFANNLREKRMKIRDIYNLLFGTAKDEADIETSSIVFEEDISDNELAGYLESKGVSGVSDSVRHIKKIKQEIDAAHTLRGRRMMRTIMPYLVEKALSLLATENALNNLVQFMQVLSTNEPYLQTFIENRAFGEALIEVFSQSDYISRMIVGNPEFIDVLTAGTARRKTLAAMKEEVRGMIGTGMPLNHAVRLFKRSEEIRLGIMFLNKQIGIDHLVKGLTKVGEAIVDVAVVETCRDLSVPSGAFVQVAAMGKFGGREITIGSDLDILFYVTEELEDICFKTAERFLRVMQAYTQDGIAYKVDTRLRPDGSKGPLVNNIKGYRNYYLFHADSWEIQALIKARPVSASRDGLCAFMMMRDEVLRERAAGITKEDILNMRKRIMTELKKPSGGIDIKLDSGGIEEIEFVIQYLQLKNADRPNILYQDTISALRSLCRSGNLDRRDMSDITTSYMFLRTVESYLRLSLKGAVREEDREIMYLSRFMGYRGPSEFLTDLGNRMENIARIAERLYDT